MRTRVVLGLALVLCAVVPVTIYLVVRATSDEVARYRSQDEIRAELLDLGTKLGTATFRVQLRAPGQDVTWYQDGPSRYRLDAKDVGAADGTPRERTFVENGSTYFSCREPGLCEQGTTELFDYGSNQAELEALGTLLVVSFHSFGQGPLESQLTRSTERIADVSGVCFTFSQSDDYEEEVCFDRYGTPLRLSVTNLEYDVVGLRYEATSISHSVDDADFEPPYPFEP